MKKKILPYIKKTIISLWSTGIFRSGLLISFFVVAGKGLSFFWKTLLFRTDPALLGLSELILASATVFSSFSLLGMNTALVRFESKYRKNKAKNVAELIPFSLLIAFGIFALLSLLTILRLIPFSFFYTSEIPLELSLILPFSLIITFQEIFLSVLLGKKQIFQFGFYKYFLQPLLRLILIFLFFFTLSSRVAAIPLHLIVAATLTTILLSFSIQKSLRITVRNLRKPSALQREFVKYVIPMSGSFVTYVIFSSLDIFFLQKFTALAVVGTYTILNTISEVLDAIMTPFLNLFHTYLGDYTDQSLSAKKKLIIKQCLFFIATSLIYIFVLYLLRHFILSFYKIDTTEIMQVLFLFLFAEALNSSIVLPLRHFFDFENYVKMTFVFMLLTLLLKIPLLWFWIPQYGLLGVAYTQLATVIFHGLLCVLGFEWYFARSKRRV